ncbi:MAG: PEGA domain-containing protein [Myxococcales bacterium]|nr:PEGA domain-containing protein [Myxococcales bacterium]
MTRRRRRSDGFRSALFALGGALVAGLAPSVARAQATSDAPIDLSEQARRHFVQGLEALDRGRFVEAAQAFERSYRLRPSAVALVNLAIVYRNQGRYLDAQGLFRRALTEGATELLPDELARARNDLARLELATPRVRFAGLPPSAELRCDGRVVARADFERGIPLDPGAHVFNVTAAGFEPEQRTIRTDPSTQQTIELSLRRSPRARLWVVVPPTLRTYAALVDGTPWEFTGRSRAVLPGTHRVRVTAEGYLPFDRTVLVNDRTTVRVDVVLSRAPPSRTWIYVVGAIAGAAALSAAIAIPVALDARAPLPTGLWDGPVSTPGRP